ncbi:cobalt ECF transporter T component CbiQ [Alkalinema sp. FACHB-956]|uniref:cobalt ECF transporter T component CbiQ n=1 Tax=Alkalinema sp. FACHB-956 TaxID=2692768 RepID=UPI0016820A74|nr:cobalt ECF transporter T component CbiQ [Alkalinema sp. FACHB-956]MBD2326682.1 cobalt ECF transporter T component CbiQ [Alkalinema sp. FACHB-956]
MIFHDSPGLGKGLAAPSATSATGPQPWMRLLCATIAVFAIALTPPLQGLQLLVMGGGLLLIGWRSSVSLGQLLRRMTLEASFALLLVLGTLFREQGDLLWQWGWLEIYQGGLLGFFSLAMKVGLSLMTLNVLTLTTRQIELLQALKQLKMPPLLVAIVGSMLRYLTVLLDEAQTLQRAAQSRNLLVSRPVHRHIVGVMIGALFIRTYDRGDRIHQAMLSRGYAGLAPEGTPLRWTKPDICLLTYTISVILLSIGAEIMF